MKWSHIVQDVLLATLGFMGMWVGGQIANMFPVNAVEDIPMRLIVAPLVTSVTVFILGAFVMLLSKTGSPTLRSGTILTNASISGAMFGITVDAQSYLFAGIALLSAITTFLAVVLLWRVQK